MGISINDRRMEGWLYLIRFNRLGLQSSQKRYFVLEDNSLNCYKSVPSSKKSDPIKSALVDSCIRVTDNGRETINKKVFFIFTLYNTTNHNDQLKLGAQSSEETAMWMQSLKEATLKECTRRADNCVTFSRATQGSLRMNRKERRRVNSIDWTSFSSVRMDSMSADVIAPSPWMIIGCNNGLRMFEEAKDGGFLGKHWDVHPAIMAVGVVDAPSEAIFRTVISLGPSRAEWDFCLSQGTVVEHLDGHTDIVHQKLRADWLPWGMKRRDLLLRRYWRREDDGTYVILYHSVIHEKCRSHKGYIRACLKSGGYVISPINQGKQSVVKHMLSIDWKLWKSYLFSSAEKHVTIRMLGRVAALRELFRAKLGTRSCSKYAGDRTREISFPYSEKEDIKVEVHSADITNDVERSRKSSARSPTIVGSFLELNDAADEFFDVPDESENDQSDNMWHGNDRVHSQDHGTSRLSATSVIVKKLHDLAVQKRGCSEQEPLLGNTLASSYGATLPKDATCNMPCSYTSAEPSTFLIRGESYLQDNHKVKANTTLMQLIAADWLKSDKREDDLGGRPGGIVQRHTLEGCSKFFFIVNMQVPGMTTYSLALYYVIDTPLEDVPLLERFVKGDDAFRNSRFKLIPYISKGSWIVKQSVGKKAGLVGQALEINYFSGKNYLELDVDVGSSTIARGVGNLVLSYLNNLVIEMAFLIQGNTPKELPEVLLGTVRLNHLDIAKAVPVNML